MTTETTLAQRAQHQAEIAAEEAREWAERAKEYAEQADRCVECAIVFSVISAWFWVCVVVF